MSNLSNETIKRLALYSGFTTKEGGDLRSYVYEFARAIENTAIARMKRDLESAVPNFTPKPFIPEGYALVPIEPTEEMWDGLARKILLAFDFNCKTPKGLISFLKKSGFEELPETILNEPEMRNLDRVISKGTRAVVVYKAMLAAAPKYEG